MNVSSLSQKPPELLRLALDQLGRERIQVVDRLARPQLPVLPITLHDQNRFAKPARSGQSAVAAGASTRSYLVARRTVVVGEVEAKPFVSRARGSRDRRGLGPRPSGIRSPGVVSERFAGGEKDGTGRAGFRPDRIWPVRFCRNRGNRNRTARITPAPAPGARPGPPPRAPVGAGSGSGGGSPAVAPRAKRFAARGRVPPATAPVRPADQQGRLGPGVRGDQIQALAGRAGRVLAGGVAPL